MAFISIYVHFGSYVMIHAILPKLITCWFGFKKKSSNWPCSDIDE